MFYLKKKLHTLRSLIVEWPRSSILLMLLLAVILYFIVRHSMVINEMIGRSEAGEPSYGWDTRTSPLMPWDVAAAEAYVYSHPDHTSYHILFGIRKTYPEKYGLIPEETKASILCSAFAHASAMNEWGCLSPGDCREGEPAKALIATGEAAIPHLESLLDDNTPALSEGSEAATYSIVYRYRIADFAHRYICLIRGWSHVFHMLPADRDKEIKLVKAKLKEKGG